MKHLDKIEKAVEILGAKKAKKATKYIKDIEKLHKKRVKMEKKFVKKGVIGRFDLNNPKHREMYESTFEINRNIADAMCNIVECIGYKKGKKLVEAGIDILDWDKLEEMEKQIKTDGLYISGSIYLAREYIADSIFGEYKEYPENWEVELKF